MELPQTVPAPPTVPVHTPQRDAFALMMNAAPTQTRKKKDSRSPVTFTVQSVVAGPPEPGTHDVAATENTATGITASDSNPTVVSATGFAPLLTVQVGKLDKVECIGFCKLLKISYQGTKVELQGAIEGEITRRHALAGTNPLEGPVFHAVLSEFSRGRAGGKFKSKKREAAREAAREADPAAETGTDLAITSAAPKVPRTSGVTARQIITKMPSEPLSEDRDGNLLCEACPWTFPKGGIFSDRVVTHVSGARHKKKLKIWLGHKTRRADIRELVHTLDEGTTLGSDVMIFRFEVVYAQMLAGLAIAPLDITRPVHERYSKLQLTSATNLSKDCE